jgi:hypothetical protein
MFPFFSSFESDGFDALDGFVEFDASDESDEFDASFEFDLIDALNEYDLSIVNVVFKTSNFFVCDLNLRVKETFPISTNSDI